MLCLLGPAFGAWHPQPPCRKAWRLQLCTGNGEAGSPATTTALLLSSGRFLFPPVPQFWVGAPAALWLWVTPSPPGSHCLVET